MTGLISPHDRMFAGDVEHYEWVGRSAVRWIRHSLKAAGKEPVKSILDFPCGYGRVMRRLAIAFPQAELTPCDIDREAVDFCVDAFDAIPAYSSTDPSELDLGQHDLIWCGSLFSHLRDWEPFLDLFRRSLTPDGLLVFTTLGRPAAELMREGDAHGLTDTEPILHDFDQHGIGFASFPNREDYGITLASPSYVTDKLEGWTLVSYTEGAWANHQDVIAVTSSG